MRFFCSPFVPSRDKLCTGAALRNCGENYGTTIDRIIYKSGCLLIGSTFKHVAFDMKVISDIVENERTWLDTAESISLNLSEIWSGDLLKPDGKIDVFDFFSGCGGMSAGFASVNHAFPAYRLAMAVDLDDDANATYCTNLGLKPHKIDIAQLAEDCSAAKELINEARQSQNSPFVMIGCAPCQGFSSHRNASGEVDKRNSLFTSFARIACAAQPDAIIIENVPEILTDRYWPLVEASREMFAANGYFSHLSVHDMAEFGVPQHRYRALLIAMKRPFKAPQGFVSREHSRTVRDAIGNLPSIVPGHPSTSDPMHFTAGHRQTTIDTIKRVPLNGGSRPFDAGPDCLRRAANKSGRAAYEDVYGRLWWDKPAITITAYARNPASGRYVHPEQHRGLSVREAALLQSFPQHFYFEGSFDSKFRQIGNAVPPAFSSYLASHLLIEIHRDSSVTAASDGINVPVGPTFSRLIPALKAGHRNLETSLRAKKLVA
ncbi:hypothetical protein CO674_29860 [Rhizobium hidalgonense]|uniref:DNA (cytosine-5-)-methyltransferase n=2 Tax=Rhizobium hidalgonense TaxID=1538159 RepID=A0ABX4JJ27_9HYPH|nr:hypothetical protein CO674_29860 [Rhizobium hidalgonense]